MTQVELDAILDADPYHVTRTRNSEAEIRLYLREVDYHCPLCGNELQAWNQPKPDLKEFQVAHIYPHRPTIQQYLVLKNLERLGKTSEDFENKIALCLGCHNRQDFHTTKEDYEFLLEIKKRLLAKSALHSAVEEMSLENELKSIVNRIRDVSLSDIANLTMKPVPISQKFGEEDAPLKAKITGYVVQYYTLVREMFREEDGKNGFVFSALCLEIRAAFEKMASISDDKEEIYNQMVTFIKNETNSSSQNACEIVAAFFVQNCEVFNEISQ